MISCSQHWTPAILGCACSVTGVSCDSLVHTILGLCCAFCLTAHREGWEGYLDFSSWGSMTAQPCKKQWSRVLAGYPHAVA
jgi:hypothetical protein